MSPVSETKPDQYIDNGWPRELAEAGDHAVSEFAAHLSGALSPFGDVEFPQPAAGLPYIHPKTEINR